MAKITLDEGVINQVKELAAQAYGHDSTSAGKGRIGMIGGHVVKFNTHREERWSKSGSMTDMRASCDALRVHLGEIARNAYDEGFTDGMRKLLSKLGLDAEGKVLPQAQDLLSRKTIVAFIDQLKRDSTNLDAAMVHERGAATVKHSMFADVSDTQMCNLMRDVVSDVRNGANTAFANAARDSLSDMDEDRKMLFSKFLVAQIKASGNGRSFNSDIKSRADAHVLLDKMFRDANSDLCEKLKCLGGLKENKSAVTRFLEVVPACIEPKHFTFLSRLMDSLLKEKPEAFDSKEAFAAELKLRLGLDGRLTKKETADIQGTISRLAGDLTRKLDDFSGTAEKVKLRDGTTLKATLERLANEAVEEIAQFSVIPNGAKLGDVKSALFNNLRIRCKSIGRLVPSEADVKIALFNTICKLRIEPLRHGNDPKVDFRTNSDMRQAEDEILKLDGVFLAAKIKTVSLEIERKYPVFRADAKAAYGKARDEIKNLGTNFGLVLTDDDINMSAVDDKLSTSDLSSVDSREKVEGVVENKRVKALRSLAEGLVSSQKIPGPAKTVIFKRACAEKSILDGLAGMMEIMMSGYEDNLSKSIPKMFKAIDESKATIEELMAQKPEGKVGEGNLEVQIAAMKELMHEQFAAMTRAFMEHICVPVEKSQESTLSADDAVSLAVLFGNVLADVGKFEQLHRLADFLMNDPDYNAWFEGAGAELFDKADMFRRENFLAPLSFVEYEPDK